MALEPLLEELRHLLGSDHAVAYCPVLRGEHWELEFSHWAGPEGKLRERNHRAFVRSSPSETPTFAAYDPFAVERSQQNIALTTGALFRVQRCAPQRHRQVYTALGVRDSDQLRMLICQGPRLLAWIGVVRGQPFDEDDARILQALAGTLTQRFAAHRETSAAPAHARLLEHVLDSLGEPAFLLSAKGQVEFCNDAARVLLESDHGRFSFSALQRAILRGQTTGDFTVTTLRSCGVPDYLLAIHNQRPSNRALAVARAGRAWQLRSRATAVLEQVARGLGNKEIASELACAEVTVEKQLTQIFRSANVRSRVELLSKLSEFFGW